jgi:hypothetical protein
MKTAYILGPMTGYVDENRPTFRAVASALRDRGYTVVSPDELDQTHPVGKKAPTWHEYMRRDIPHLATAQIGFALPGWRNSQGAQLEALVLSKLGCPIHEVSIRDDRVYIQDTPTDRLPGILMPPPAH